MRGATEMLGCGCLPRILECDAQATHFGIQAACARHGLDFHRGQRTNRSQCCGQPRQLCANIIKTVACTQWHSDDDCTTMPCRSLPQMFLSLTPACHSPSAQQRLPGTASVPATQRKPADQAQQLLGQVREQVQERMGAGCNLMMTRVWI